MRPEIVETAPASAMELARGTRNPIRKLYFWTLHWAATPYAVPALIGLSFAESSFFPVPPDVLLMAMTFSLPARWARYALWCSLASIVGGMVGYLIGWGLWDSVGKPIVDFYQGQELMARIQGWYAEYGFWGVLAAAVTPIPYKVFTIASGWFHFDFGLFVLASAIGRPFRFFLVAGLVGRYGARIRPFLEQKLEWALLALTAAAVLGFLAIKWLG
jgi:membrane protein YqaA with SNARE-associated domain